MTAGRIAASALAALVSFTAIASAQEDDDDPKAVAAPRPRKALPKAPLAERAERIDKAPAAPVEKSERSTTTITVERIEPAHPAARPVAADKPVVRATDRPNAAKPSSIKVVESKRPTLPPPVAAPEVPAPATPLPTRNVRVKLVDGSMVVGVVNAEQAEALVIDCALGRLAIPRVRISTISYDAPPTGAKRAPVQQLDDDDRPVARKRAP